MLTAMMQAARDHVRAKVIADPILSAAFKELTQLDGDPPDIETLPEGFILYEVRGVIEDTPPPEERYTIYVKVKEIKSDLDFLKDWIIETSVGTPIDVEGVDVEGHSMLELAVTRIWDKALPENANAETELAAHIAAKIPGWTGGGYHAQGWDEAREGTELLPVYEVKAGVMKANL